ELERVEETALQQFGVGGGRGQVQTPGEYRLELGDDLVTHGGAVRRERRHRGTARAAPGGRSCRWRSWAGDRGGASAPAACTRAAALPGTGAATPTTARSRGPARTRSRSAPPRTGTSATPPPPPRRRRPRRAARSRSRPARYGVPGS